MTDEGIVRYIEATIMHGDLTTARTNLPAGPATLGTLTVPENWDKPAKLIHPAPA